MIALDTNVISELNKPRPSERVLNWFDQQAEDDLFLTEITDMEFAYGAEKHILKTGSNRYYLVLERLMREQFQNQILRWLPNTSFSGGQIRARREMNGHSIGIQDAMIAATCLSHGATLATRNVRDFEGLDLPLINPFEGP